MFGIQLHRFKYLNNNLTITFSTLCASRAPFFFFYQNTIQIM